MMEGAAHNPHVESERMEFEADAKYGRHSLDKKTIGKEVVGGHHLTRRASLLHIIPSRYLSGSVGSCHDLCKAGHRHDSDEKTKKSHLVMPTPVRSVLLRTQSEREDPPKEKSMFRHSGSLRGRSNDNKPAEKPGISSHRKVHPVNASSPLKPSVKRARSMDARRIEPEELLSRKNQARRQRDAKPKEPEDVPERTLHMIEPLKTSQRATLCEKRLPRSRRGSCVGTREGNKDSLFTKADVDQSRDKGSSTWKRKLKEATIAALSSGIIGKKVEVDDRKGSYENKEVVMEEPHGKGSELGEVVLRHHETMGKKEDKETAIKPVKSRKNTVKTLVGAFEALISLGDRRSLVAVSAS